MEPLKTVPMPTHGVVVSITADNSWKTGTDTQAVRYAYIATDSTQQMSFVALQSASHPERVSGLASRPSRFADMESGVVIELYLVEDLAADEVVHVALAHAGASVYYPPQPIDDAP
jgi:hypothetical protein